MSDAQAVEISSVVGPNGCTAHTRNGELCSGIAIKGSDLCMFHHPDYRESVEAARSRGGQGRHGRTIGEILDAAEIAPVQLRTPEHALALLEVAATDLMHFERSIARAKAIAAIVGMALKVMSDSDFERRLAELEAKAAQ